MSPELAATLSAFLADAEERGDRGEEFTVVSEDGEGRETRRGWRFDARVAFKGKSFLLTPEREWFSALRTGPSSFGWGRLRGEELELALEEWNDELIGLLHRR